MRKKLRIGLLLLLLILALVYAWSNRVNYAVQDGISDAEANPKQGVHLAIDANRKTGTLSIENHSGQNIVIDFGRKRLEIELRREDGWHRLLASNYVNDPTYAVADGSTASLDFTWRAFVDGPLKPGRYRAILFFGDGSSGIDAYSVTAEFEIN